MTKDRIGCTVRY